jgi:hypothetical protein
LDAQSKVTLWPAPLGQALGKRLNEHFPRATLILSFFEDAVYERMQVVEMARAQAVWQKSGGRISVTTRLIPPPYLAQLSPPNSKPAIPPPNRALPLRRSKAMAGACALAMMRRSAAAFTGVPSPSSSTSVRVGPLRLHVRTLKPWLWKMCNQHEISYLSVDVLDLVQTCLA